LTTVARVEGEQGGEIDVAVVGYGPVGQALACLLGAAGHRVACFERHGEIYRLPRAVHADHEVMRLLQRLGIAHDLAGEMLSLTDYHWFGADGETLMVLSQPSPGVSGWEPDWLFFQPTLEDALDRRARSLRGVSVECGWDVEGLEQDDGGVTLSLRPFSEDPAAEPEASVQRPVRARYLIGADGANSTVRAALGVPQRDLGFRERWFVVDVVPHDIDALDLPAACQWCDPRRPTTHVRSGVGHRRWEFMLLPGESEDEFDERRAWELLAPWLGPDDAVLLRHTVYEFRSMVAEQMREHRVLLAGDAAHLTPPFLGQGLCSGLRDAANIAWKLDLVLRGVAGDALLDTVTPERQLQNEWIISFAIELGKVLCELDPDRAAERDTNVRGAGPPPVIALPPLQDQSDGERAPLAGELSVQGVVALDGREGLLDDVAGAGFTLICRGGATDCLDEAQRGLLDLLGVSVVDFGAGARDVDGRTTAWLDENAVDAVLVRPDLYVVGGAADGPALARLLDDLRARLGTPAAQAH